MKKATASFWSMAVALLVVTAFGCDGNGASGSSPRISSIVPSKVATGDFITINGTNLSGASVLIQGISTFITANTSTSISTSVPAGATVGVQEVKVTTDEGTATSSIDIDRVGAPPTVTSIAPDPVSLGQQIVITGTGFQGGVGVEVATVLATVESFTATTITATVPSTGIVRGQQASVRVTTQLGTVVSQVFINN